MAQTNESAGVASAPTPALNQEQLGRLLLEPLNHGMAAATRKALEIGVPAHRVVEMQINHLASTIAMVEPEGAREGLLLDVMKQLAPMVAKHYEARFMTAGGVFVPGGNGRG